MTMTRHPTIRLRDGQQIPAIGLGVYQMPPGEVTQRAVLDALSLGYRHVDTARIYDNEKDVGEAIRRSDVPRDEIYVTTKLWNADHGYDSTQVLVRWGIQHGWVSLPKSRRRARIEENAQVFDFELARDDMRDLDALHEDLHTSWDPTDAP